MKSILKTCFMLFRNVVMFALMYAWLIKDIVGPGRVLSAYIVGVAALVLLSLFYPIKPEKALQVSLAGKFWRGVEVACQYVILIGLIWFAHYFVAIAWLVACLGLSLMRHRILEAKKKAQKEWMDRDAAAIMSVFAGMNQQFPPAEPA